VGVVGVVGVVVVGVVLVVEVVLLVELDEGEAAAAALVAVETAVVRDPSVEEPSATATPANIASDTIVAAKAAV